jgi:hypothetical protein
MLPWFSAPCQSELIVDLGPGWHLHSGMLFQDEQGNFFEVFQATEVSSKKDCDSWSTTSLVVVGLLAAGAGGLLGFLAGAAAGTAVGVLGSKKLNLDDDQDDVVSRRIQSPNHFRWDSVVQVDKVVVAWREPGPDGKEVYRAANIDTGKVWPMSYGTREELESNFDSQIVPYLT